MLEKNRVHNHAFRGSGHAGRGAEANLYSAPDFQVPGVCHRYYARAELILDESAPAESASSRLKKEPSSRWAHMPCQLLACTALVYLGIPGYSATAQDTQPARATFAEMIAFARLASVACQQIAPDAEALHAFALQRFIKPPLTDKEIAAKEKEVKQLRNRVGLAQWCRRYAGKMEQARIQVQVLRGKN